MFHTSHNAHSEIQGFDAAWLRDFAQIDSLYGRLVYLAGLRNADTGRYEHFSLLRLPNALVASRSIRRLHETIFRDWVSYPLAQKKADIELYITSLAQPVEKAELIDAWLRLRPYLNLVPASVQGPERHKHVSDFEAILGLMRNVYGVPAPDQNA